MSFTQTGIGVLGLVATATFLVQSVTDVENEPEHFHVAEPPRITATIDGMDTLDGGGDIQAVVTWTIYTSSGDELVLTTQANMEIEVTE